jgi:tRNA U38,U39,U40 pseudouridine synthase TruA
MTRMCGQNIGEVQLDTRILPDFIQHISHQISLKQANHYFQLMQNDKFRHYDYKSDNFKRYNSSLPPDYKLRNVKAKTYIYSGGSDGIVSEIDIEKLRKKLPNVKGYRSIRNFNHCDFNYGKNTRTILSEDIMKTMDSETNLAVNENRKMKCR